MSEDGVGSKADSQSETKRNIDKTHSLDSEANTESDVKETRITLESEQNPIGDEVNLSEPTDEKTNLEPELDTGKNISSVNLKTDQETANDPQLIEQGDNNQSADGSNSSAIDETVVIEPVVASDRTPQTPEFGEIRKSPIEIIHALGDLHGWAPGLISYLIHHKLATVEIDGYPLQTESGDLNRHNLELIFPDPVAILRKARRNPPRAGLSDQPGFTDLGLNGEGHGNIKARWIADDNVALIQVGDIFDRADHSELAAEILRQLIIDAPGRVFVLVGNHEQFMLENDFDNWYFNEARSAWIDTDSSPKRSAKNHFRFLPKWDLKSVEERAKATFERYINATETLFLTQGAVMQKLGWLKETVLDLSSMLGEGWSGYEHASKLIAKLYEDGPKIPGAITALVITDTLFHHAEPSAHRTEDTQGLQTPLYNTMTKPHGPNKIQFRTYTSGNGGLKASPDAPLLWSRGSSVGAANGRPAAESHIAGLVRAWPGLKRIIHGHTPTVTNGDFDSVTDGKSASVSYLGDSKTRIMERGRANKVRIYNIDEGMSPVYYSGDSGPYDPLRMPTGLRLEKDDDSTLESLDDTNQFVNLDPNHDIVTDVRKLWRWNCGEWRNSASDDWTSLKQKSHTKSVLHGSWQGFITIPNEGSESSKTLYNRSISGTQIGRLMVQKLLNDCFSQGSIEIQEPRQAVLERIGPVGELLSKGKAKLAWNQFKSLLVLLKPNQKGGFSCILCNSTGADQRVIVAAYNNNKLTKPIELKVESSHVSLFKLSSVERIFVGLTHDSIQAASKDWADVKDSAQVIESPVVGYYSNETKFAKRLELVETPNKIPLFLFTPKQHQDFKKREEASKKKPQNEGSYHSSGNFSGAPSLKHQGSRNKNQRSPVKNIREQQQENHQAENKVGKTQADRLDQQGTVKNSGTKVARPKAPQNDRYQRSPPSEGTLNSQRSNINSETSRAIHGPKKAKITQSNPNLNTKNPATEASPPSNQNQQSSKTNKSSESDLSKTFQAFQFGVQNRSKIRIYRRDNDARMTLFDHIEFKVTELTTSTATIEFVIEEPGKSPVKFLLKWSFLDETPIKTMHGGSGFTTDYILKNWKKKHLKNYIYEFIEKLTLEGEK